jgi:membrane-associated phospholipid phosphatase
MTTEIPPPAWAQPPRALGTPTDRMIAWYAIVSGSALLFPHRPAWWPALAALHVAAAAFGFGLAPARAAWEALYARAPRLARTLGDWYPLLLTPLLYTELAVLNRAVHDGAYFDAIIIAWEAALFGSQPSAEWAALAPWRWLSEPLHAAYLAYYPIIFGPPLVLYLLRRYAAFERVVFTLMLVFFAHYVFFIYFPVQGPRFLFPVPTSELATGPFYRLAHRLLEAGSSQGAAFPSSHVGVAVAQAMLVARYLPRAGAPFAVVAAALSIGAVYAGFHYATDAFAGLILGAALMLAAPAVWRAFGGSGARHGETKGRAVPRAARDRKRSLHP